MIIKKILNALKAVYRPYLPRGAATPPGDIWKTYAVGLGCVILILLPIADGHLASLAGEEVEQWRIYMGWGMIGFCVFFLVYRR